ncbi:MAG: DNA repair protein RecN [Lachnospiraceae bacterium]|nr:DNA repair protein RecN [Lachnospiraceae bacterium]
MLESLKVKNLALIENCEIEFTKGLNILTGETGAGKSILLGSVNLALGARAEGDVIRSGADEALVELVFSSSQRTDAILKELDLPTDDVVLITRKITPSKSIYKINGETVISKQVKELASALIDIHGQHEHQSLLNTSRQLKMLDAFAKDDTESLLTDVAKAAKEYKETVEKLDEAKTLSEGRDREISLLEYELKEIEEADLKLGEDAEAEAEYKRLSSAEKLKESVSEALNLISDGNAGDAGSLLSRAIGALEKAASLDESAGALKDILAQAESLFGDFSLEAYKYCENLEYDPEEFDRLEKRLDTINSLKARFGRTIDDVLKYRDEKSEELERLKNLDEYLSKLTDEAASKKAEYVSLAGKLSEVRKNSAKVFEKELIKTLAGLNFSQVRFEVAISSDKERIASNGFDDIEFMISTNPGEPVKPVKNVASGGELSRIMLGIKTILAGVDDIDSLIFDEIDTGISGITAREVGKRLKELSAKHQVIAITHLAQIAALSDTHFVIEKNVEGGKTKTEISRMDVDQRLKELARLLGGDENSKAALDNARELINSL